MVKTTLINATVPTREDIYRQQLAGNVVFIDRYKFISLFADKNSNRAEPQVEYFFIYRTQPFLVSDAIFQRVSPVFFGVSPSYPGVFFKIPTYSTSAGEQVEEKAFKTQYQQMKTKSPSLDPLRILLTKDQSTDELNDLYTPEKLIKDHVDKTSKTILKLPEFVALKKYAKTLQGKWFAPEANIKGKKLENLLKEFPSPASLEILIDLSIEKVNKIVGSNLYSSTNDTTINPEVLLYDLVKPRQRAPFFLTASKASRTETFNLLMDLKETMERNHLFDDLEGNSVPEVTGRSLQ